MQSFRARIVIIVMRVLFDTWRQMLDELGAAPVESGGILGRRGDTVCAFFLDPQGGREYVPDTGALNRKMSEWAGAGISFAGIAHSHPNGVTCLSSQDTEYGEHIAAATDIETLYFPVLSPHNGKIHIAVYSYGAGAWRREKIDINHSFRGKK